MHSSLFPLINVGFYNIQNVYRSFVSNYSSHFDWKKTIRQLKSVFHLLFSRPRSKKQCFYIRKKLKHAIVLDKILEIQNSLTLSNPALQSTDMKHETHWVLSHSEGWRRESICCIYAWKLLSSVLWKLWVIAEWFLKSLLAPPPLLTSFLPSFPSTLPGWHNFELWPL